MNQFENDTETDIGNLFGNPHKCILFNDDHHTFEEVVAQVILAVKCDYSNATALTTKAHVSGSAVVFTGSLERCEFVSGVLEKIGLATAVEEA